MGGANKLDTYKLDLFGGGGGADTCDVADAAANTDSDVADAVVDTDTYDTSLTDSVSDDGAEAGSLATNDALVGDSGGPPSPDPLDPLPFGSPLPPDKPKICEDKPIVPFRQIDYDAPFNVYYHPILNLDGH